MRLWAISDLHLGHSPNDLALDKMPSHPEDWLILAGDTGETVEHLRRTLEILTPRFKQLLWVPGNHDLWVMPEEDPQLRGDARYRRLVQVCQEFGALTPEDPYPEWPGEGPRCKLAPLFLLYDYSFRPDNIPRDQALDWAIESGIVAADERYLHPDPYPSRDAWCEARCRYTEERLAEASADLPLVLINHFPLKQQLAHIPLYPRFSLWCGTRMTEDWHIRFRALAVVSGHLHMRATRWRDGVRFEEVSLGYPRQWEVSRGVGEYLRQILPVPESFPFARE